MVNHEGQKRMNKQRAPKTLKISRRFSVFAILALVTSCVGVLLILLNFSISNEDKIILLTENSSEMSSDGNQGRQITIRSPSSITEISGTETAIRSKGRKLKPNQYERKSRHSGQYSSATQPGEQPFIQPYGLSNHKPDIQTNSIPDDDTDREIEDIDDEIEDEPQEFLISGWVFTQTGEPVPYIQLTAVARQLFQKNDSWSTAGIEREQRTQTDSHGFFEFWQLGDGEYEVRTQATERYSAARAVLRTGTTSATLVVEEEDEQEVYVYGYAESTNGKLLEGVRVLPIGQKQVTVTDKTGNYGLYLIVNRSRQSYTLRFMKEGYREQRLTLDGTDVGVVDNFQLDVKLDPIETLTTVTGTVTGPNGSPVVHAAVQLLSTGLENSYRVGTNFYGDFLIPRVEIAADYRLWVRPRDRYKDYIESGLVVPAAGLDLDIVLDPQGLSSLRGQMLNLDGKPVPRFGIWLRSNSVTTPPALLVTGDQLGYFFVDELPAGEINFRTNSFPYISVSGIALASGAEEYVQLTLDWGNYMMAGYVLNSEDEPVSGAQVSLFWRYDNKEMKSRSKRKTVADAGGYFLFENLGPGMHTFNITAPGFYSVQRDYDVKTTGEAIRVQLEAITP
jgi:hypothetical protein